MELEEAVKDNIISLEDYNKVVEHIEEVNRIISKYDYITKNCVNKWHGIKCRVTDIKQSLDSIGHDFVNNK